jgi:hypothetical protein
MLQALKGEVTAAEARLEEAHAEVEGDRGISPKPSAKR